MKSKGERVSSATFRPEIAKLAGDHSLSIGDIFWPIEISCYWNMKDIDALTKSAESVPGKWG